MMPMSVRLNKDALPRYVERGELDPAAAAQLASVCDTLDAIVNGHAAAQNAILANDGLNATGRERALKELNAATKAKLAELEGLAAYHADQFARLDDIADALERQPDGTWRERYPRPPTAEEQADHREIRRAVEGRPVREVRALYLAEVQQHGRSPLTEALERDPALRARPDPFLDPDTARRAQALRRERSGVAARIVQVQTAARVSGELVASIVRELDLPVDRPAPERVTSGRG